MAELRVCLHIFWRLGQVKQFPRFLTDAQLASDAMLMGVLSGADLAAALKAADSRGTLLTLAVEQDGVRRQLYFINDQYSRRAVDRIARGELVVSLPGEQAEGPLDLVKPAPNAPAGIFTLYEQNIGLLTPILAEELAEAEKKYPAPWIEEAFREAVRLNKRNWKYISRILERWATEGKEDGEARRHPEAVQPTRTTRGRRHPLWG